MRSSRNTRFYLFFQNEINVSKECTMAIIVGYQLSINRSRNLCNRKPFAVARIYLLGAIHRHTLLGFSVNSEVVVINRLAQSIKIKKNILRFFHLRQFYLLK